MKLKKLKEKIYQDYKKLINEMNITSKRQKHIESSIKLAYYLCEKYNLDKYKGVLSAWLHDYFRDRSRKEILELAYKYDVKLNKFTKKYPVVLHGDVAVKYFKKQGYKLPKQVLKSIKYHTLGSKKLDDYGKLLFIVDAVEETRSYDGVESLREFVKNNSFYESYKEVLKRTITDLIRKNKEISIKTVKAYNSIMEVD